MKQAFAGQMAVMKEYFDRSTRALEEADSGFAPQPGLFTTAQIVAHVAQTIDWFLDGAFATEGFNLDFEKMDADVRGFTSLAAARAWFDKACAGLQSAVESRSEEEWATALPPGPIMGGLPRHSIFGALTDHTAHHRGALTVYTRLRGKVPPMPYMDM